MSARGGGEVRAPAPPTRRRAITAVLGITSTLVLLPLSAAAPALPPATAATALQPPTADRAPGDVPTGSLWSLLDDLSLRDLEGREWRRSDLEGRWVLLDFWATWCAPCIADLPILRTLPDRWPGRFQLLGISMDTMERRELESWLRRRQVGWPQLHDGRGMRGPLAARLGVEAVPRTILVDPAGRIVAVDLRGEELVVALENLLGDRDRTDDPQARSKRAASP